MFLGGYSYHVWIKLGRKLWNAASHGNRERYSGVDCGSDGGGPAAAAEAKQHDVLVAEAECIVDGKNLEEERGVG